jgi:very-short-patch-repair endonuclease
VSRSRQRNPDTDNSVAELAARQWGIVDNEDLWALGLSRDAVMTRRRNGRLRVVYPGVYALGHSALCLKGRFLAATKATGGVLSHKSDAVIWEIFPWDEDWLPEVTVTTSHTRNIPGIVVHRTRRPFKVVHFDGIPVTTAARALIDLSATMSFDPLRRAIREAMALKRVTLKELVGGSKALRAIVADGYVPTQSEFEDAVHDLLKTGGFALPEVGKVISIGGKWTKPDFRWPEQRLILEADGAQWHDHLLAKEDDAARQARLEAAGERVIRVKWRQLIDHPRQTLARLESAGAPRCFAFVTKSPSSAPAPTE